MSLSKICLTSYRVEGPDAAKKAAAYDVEIEVDDPKKEAMRDFMMSPQSQSVRFLHMKLLFILYVILITKIYQTFIILSQTVL